MKGFCINQFDIKLLANSSDLFARHGLRNRYTEPQHSVPRAGKQHTFSFSLGLQICSLGMRARYKWPDGTGIITLGDDATLGDVVKELTSKTLLTNFGIKFGPPTAMKALDMSRTDQSAKKLGLHGETLTIVPNEAQPSPSTSEDLPEPHGGQKARPQDVNVPWGVRDGTLCRSEIHKEY